MSRPLVRELLRASLPSRCLITEPAALKPYETDGLTAIREMPWLVALPETEVQLKAVMRICAQYDVPIVPRGAGTGLSGGARPVKDGIVLGLSKLNKILEIDLDNCVARVQPGVRNLAITEAVAEHGLYYAPDPSSQIACSIGGNVAENSGGVHCLKYGLTVHNVLGLKVVTALGDTLTIGGKSLDPPGYDLLALMCGSEGMLGVVIEVTVKLLPEPPAKVVVLAAYNSLQEAADAVTDIFRQGIVPAGLEMMDKLAIQAAEDFVHAGYPRSAEAILLCELDGDDAEIADLETVVVRILKAAGAFEVQQARDPLAQARMWQGRKAAFPAVGRISPDYYCMDGTIPRRQLSQVLEAITQLSVEFGLGVANVFHAGDGNLHPLILYDANVPGELDKAEAMGGKILELCVAAGGSVTGEHGVGVEKLDQMCVQFNEAELRQFERVKEAFDPERLLNPGKAIPTLTRCSELGGMHVHGGKLPFPKMERF
jgi:glycolate oxidase